MSAANSKKTSPEMGLIRENFNLRLPAMDLCSGECICCTFPSVWLGWLAATSISAVLVFVANSAHIFELKVTTCKCGYVVWLQTVQSRI